MTDADVIAELDAVFADRLETVIEERNRAQQACKLMGERIVELEAALRAIINRWDSPSWKEAEPTGHVISRARKLLEK